MYASKRSGPKNDWNYQELVASAVTAVHLDGLVVSDVAFR
jgi:hypothetical protein